MPVGSQIYETFPSKGLKAGASKASKIQSPQFLSFDDVTEDISFPTISCLPLVYRFSPGIAPPVRQLQTLTWCLFHISQRWGKARERENDR